MTKTTLHWYLFEFVYTNHDWRQRIFIYEYIEHHGSTLTHWQLAISYTLNLHGLPGNCVLVAARLIAQITHCTDSMEPLFQSIKNLTMSIFFTIALAFMDLAYFSPQEDHKTVKFDSQYTGNVGSQYIQSSTLPRPLFPMLPSPARAASRCSLSTMVGNFIILSDPWGRQSNALFRRVVGTASPSLPRKHQG